MLGIRHEFVWKHTPEQNGHAESFHVTLKREYVWPHDFARFQDAEAVLTKALVDYKGRIHSVLGHITPSEFVCKLDGGNKWGTDSFGKSAESGIKNRGPDHDCAPAGPLGEPPPPLRPRVRLLHLYEQQIKFLERHAHEGLETPSVS